MGKTFSTGLLTNGVFQDSSNNIGIGAAPSGTYKLEVTGTAKVSSTLLVSGAATFSSSVALGSTLNSTTAALLVENAGIYGSWVELKATSTGGKRWIMQSTGVSAGEGAGKLVLNNASDGITAMTITSAGNVGIGSTNPTARLDINNTSGDANLFLGSPTGSGSFIKLFNNSVGKWFIGTNATGSPDNDLAIYGYGGQNGNIISYTNGAERMRITSGGNVFFQKTSGSTTSGIGGAFITDPAAPWFSVVGNSNYIYFFNQDAVAYRFYVTGAGVINATSTSITAISDISLKENIRDLETGLSEVMKLKPRRFDWKEETKIGEKNVAGFIAQELEEVLPELVYDYKYNATETKKSVKMGDILPTLVKAIQEMNTKLDEQNQTIQSLQERITKAGL